MAVKFVMWCFVTQFIPLLQPLESRIFIMYTLYNLAEVFILAALVDYFDNHPHYSR